MDPNNYNELQLPDLLPVYYNRIFPGNELFRWLSYGDPSLCENREISFTLIGDVYLRYQCFKTSEDFVKSLFKNFPLKIDIGAIYKHSPASKVPASCLVPVQKEVVFDIDLTDYDDVRTCCSEAKVCPKCWKFMVIACKVLDAALRIDFGFECILWVFSGRRGIHCWVCDEEARKLDDYMRAGVAEYLQVLKGGSNVGKKASLPGEHIHPSVKRAISIIDEYFVDAIIVEQDILGTPERLENFYKMFLDEVRDKFVRDMEKFETSKERWACFENTFDYLLQKGEIPRKLKRLKEEIKLHYAHPRLDINVSKNLNHLLKSPFCVHPKTGKICVPLNPKLIDNFNVSTVPHVGLVVNEINLYDAKTKEQEEKFSENIDKSTQTSVKIRDYKKTSLLKYVNMFNDILRSFRRPNINNKSVQF